MAAQRRTQGELAEALGTTVPMVARRMNGSVEFSATELVGAARFLGVSVDSLLGETNGDRVGAA
jgi:transcriptional regulator with XRE-family HTH domain